MTPLFALFCCVLVTDCLCPFGLCFGWVLCACRAYCVCERVVATRHIAIGDQIGLWGIHDHRHIDRHHAITTSQQIHNEHQHDNAGNITQGLGAWMSPRRLRRRSAPSARRGRPPRRERSSAAWAETMLKMYSSWSCPHSYLYLQFLTQ